VCRGFPGYGRRFPRCGRRFSRPSRQVQSCQRAMVGGGLDDGRLVAMGTADSSCVPSRRRESSMSGENLSVRPPPGFSLKESAVGPGGATRRVLRRRASRGRVDLELVPTPVMASQFHSGRGGWARCPLRWYPSTPPRVGTSFARPRGRVLRPGTRAGSRSVGRTHPAGTSAQRWAAGVVAEAGLRCGYWAGPCCFVGRCVSSGIGIRQKPPSPSGRLRSADRRAPDSVSSPEGSRLRVRASAPVGCSPRAPD
jgi:hypothetical protein